MNFQSHRYSQKSSIPRASLSEGGEATLHNQSFLDFFPLGHTNLQLIFHLNFSLPYNNRKPNTSHRTEAKVPKYVELSQDALLAAAIVQGKHLA